MIKLNKLFICIILILGFFFISNGCNENIDEVTINFECDGGNTIDKITVKSNEIESFKLTSVTVKKGYEFAGWFIDKDFTIAYSDLTSLVKDKSYPINITLFAKWQKSADIVVKYETNGGSIIEDTKILDASQINFTLPTNPVKDGFTFDGWYLDDEYEFPFENISPLVEGSKLPTTIILYAKWKEAVKDEVKPLITYVGSLGKDPVWALDSDIDFLEGMFAIDNVDGIISDKIVVETPDFDKSVAGVYYVFYSVKDNAGNSSEVFVRMFTLKKIFPGDVLSEGSLDSLNGVRYDNYMVYYSYKAKGQTTTANQWGYEISVNPDGYVIEVDTNITMVEGGFALSAVGNKKTILQTVEVGDLVTVDIKTKTYTIVRNKEKSNLFKIQYNIEKTGILIEEASNAGIDFDNEEVNKAYQEIKDLKKLTEKEEITEEEIISISQDVKNKSEAISYMITYTKDSEVRAVWHRPNVTGCEVDLKGVISVLDRFQKYGFNVIFLETFWNGYVSYRSDILETHPNLIKFSYGEEYGNDYILAFVSEAKKRGISVHAWCHVFNAGSKGLRSSVVKDSMLVEDYQGRTLHPNEYGGAYYYDPSNPEVIELLNNVMKEMITKYQFGGVQYDYIRYCDNNYNSTPIRDSGYGAAPEERFKVAYGLTGNVRDLILNSDVLQKWNEWRMKNVTNAVHKFSQTIKQCNKSAVISAAVVSPIATARSTYSQDWLTWVKAGDIDLLCPMIYTGSSKAIASQSETIVSQLENKTLLAAGIAPTYYGYSILIAHNEIAATKSGAGYAYFASQNVLNIFDLTDALEIGMNRLEVISPFEESEKVKNFVLNKVLARIDSIYVKRNLLTNEQVSEVKAAINEIIGMSANNTSLVISKLETLKAKDYLQKYVIIDDINNLIQIFKYKNTK